MTEKEFAKVGISEMMKLGLIDDPKVVLDVHMEKVKKGLGADVMAALFRARSTAYAINIVYGLGGRDVRVEDMEKVFADLKQIIDDDDAGETYRYMGVRE